jgi:uncharacterized membrane protein YphA (DoxX/SURF4 family)
MALSAVRIGMGLFFISAAIAKVRFPYDFLISVYGYGFVGPKFSMTLAVILPWLELLVGVCLVSGFLGSSAMLCTALLSAAFFIAQASALIRGLDISCGCFGSADNDMVSYSTLLRSGAILFVACFAYYQMLKQDARPVCSGAAISLDPMPDLEARSFSATVADPDSSSS